MNIFETVGNISSFNFILHFLPDIFLWLISAQILQNHSPNWSLTESFRRPTKNVIERYALLLNSISCLMPYLRPILWDIPHLQQSNPTQFLNPFSSFFHFFKTSQTRGLQFWRPSIHRLNTWLSLDFGHVCTWVCEARSPTFERTPSGPLKRFSHYAIHLAEQPTRATTTCAKTKCPKKFRKKGELEVLKQQLLTLILSWKILRLDVEL